MYIKLCISMYLSMYIKLCISQRYVHNLESISENFVCIGVKEFY